VIIKPHRRYPMAATDRRRTFDEMGQLGPEVYERQVRPKLGPNDDNKFVAIDVDTGDFEVDADDYTAVMRLLARNPDGNIWLERAGHPTAYKMRHIR
jgi:hypothetical protein